MPMPLSDYEALLAELNSPETDKPRQTDILQALRADYTEVTTEVESLTATKTTLEKDNNDLVRSNSKLFLQAGFMKNDDKIEDVKKQEYSETITIEELEKMN